MAKRKSFFTRIVQKAKRDEGFRWSRDYLEWLREMQAGVVLDASAIAHGALLDSRFMCLQQETFIRRLDEARVEQEGTGEVDSYVYPGLTLAWETTPVTVAYDEGCSEAIKKADGAFMNVELTGLEQLFPACALIDIRDLGFSLYEVPLEGLFVYPSYDLERNHVLLLLVGMSLRYGLVFPLQSKLVVQGETFGDAVAASIQERKELSAQWWGNPAEHDLADAFSPLDDDQSVMVLAAKVLAALVAPEAKLSHAGRTGKHHIAVSYPTAAPAEPEGEQHRQAPAISSAKPEDERAPEPETAQPPECEDAAAEETARTDTDAALTVEKLKQALNEAASKQAALSYHLEQAQSTSAAAQAQARALKRRAQILDTLELPSTPLESLDLAAGVWEDRLIVLESARNSAEAFKKGDAREVWAVLRSMAVTLHPLIFGDIGTNVAFTFQAETGFELSLRDGKLINNNARLKAQRTFEYEGTMRDATPHVKGKGSKRGETLRVHFFADYEKERLVIAHCGEHLETCETSKI